ncbi:MAG: RNA methyltransferase [Acidobacteria bacterium]|nr:MAG: RNA methyltransferase [Acidobacteriota bacterium]
MREEFSPAIRPEFDRLRVVLVRTRNPLNIGAAARAMSNFGFAHLRVVNPYGPAFREARSAVGAAEVLATAEEYGSVAEAVGDCALVVGTTAVGKRSIKHAIARLEHGAEQLRKGLAAGNVSLLFGSERTGLSNKDFSHCHWLIRIPTCEVHISMNLGQAVAVCLYEIARDAAAALQPEAQSAPPGELIEQLTTVLLEALRASGYLKTKTSAYTEAKIRRQVRRLALTSVDAEAWIGMLRQMTWKMRRT